MNAIFQYILFILIGYVCGAVANFIVEWFYLRRSFLPEEEAEAIHTLGWVKFLVWPWACGACSQMKKIRIMLVEIVLAFLAVWLWKAELRTVELWWALPVLVYFTVVMVMDMEYRVVLHPISMAGAVLGLVVGTYRFTSGSMTFSEGLLTSLLGGVGGFAIMFLFYKLGEFFLRLVNRRREEEVDEVALGFGDVNMSGVMGLFIGWPPVILGMIFAIFAGGAVSILFIVFSLVAKRFKAFAAIPYAPFLVLATLVMLFFPDWVISLIG